MGMPNQVNGIHHNLCSVWIFYHSWLVQIHTYTQDFDCEEDLTKSTDHESGCGTEKWSLQFWSVQVGRSTHHRFKQINDHYVVCRVWHHSIVSDIDLDVVCTPQLYRQQVFRLLDCARQELDQLQQTARPGSHLVNAQDLMATMHDEERVPKYSIWGEDLVD